MTSLNSCKTRRAILFRLVVLCLLALNGSDARAQLTPKQARKLITRMTGFELSNGSVRVKAIAPSSLTTAEVSAEIRTVFKFEKNNLGRWRVAEIRTGPSHWEQIDLIADVLHSPITPDECTAPDPPFKGALAIDPSVKRVRCLIGGLIGVEVPSDAVRIQEVDPFTVPLAPQPSAVVVAWIKVEARLISSNESGWSVESLRIGKRDWVPLKPLVDAANTLKEKKARAELETIARALELFRSDRGFYVVADKQSVVIDHLNPRYLPQIIREDPWHQPYKYQGERDHFTLSSAGPDGKDGTADDIELVRQAR